MKMEEQQGTLESRTMNMSKNRMHQFLKGSRNTLNAGLKELEAVKLIEILPYDPAKAENRIRITLHTEWNWEIIRQRFQDGFKRSERKEPSSLFDEE